MTTTGKIKKHKRTTTELAREVKLSLTDFARLINESPRTIKRKAEDKTYGFLYRPFFIEPKFGNKTAKAWYAPWQYSLIVAVFAMGFSVESALAQREEYISEAATYLPKKENITAKLPTSGRPRKAKA